MSSASRTRNPSHSKCPMNSTLIQRRQSSDSRPKLTAEKVRPPPPPPLGVIIHFVQFNFYRVVVGELKEKEEARNTYDDAIAAGHGAYMLEQKSEKIFQASIGNLPPGKEVLVTIVYVLELQFDDAGQLRLTLPEQGFAPDGRKSMKFPTTTTSDAKINNARVPDGLTLDINLDTTSPIVQIKSDTHPQFFNSLVDAKNPRKASVRVPTSLIPLMTNFELLIQLEDASTLINQVQTDTNGNRIAMVAFHPRLHDVEPLGEIIFLVDRSGSMMGSKMARTKSTMQIFLRSLTSGVRFNIVSFGSTFSTLFDKSKDYNAESLAAATEHVTRMSADMGGTELLKPLQSIFGSSPDPMYPRQLFILTYAATLLRFPLLFLLCMFHSVMEKFRILKHASQHAEEAQEIRAFSVLASDQALPRRFAKACLERQMEILK